MSGKYALAKAKEKKRSSKTRSMLRNLEEEQGPPCKKKRPTPVTTFVFLELETTGLLTEQRDKTRITEMCLYAVKRKDLLIERPPRVTSELRLCFDPVEAISADAMALSGLTNEMLKDQPKFGKKTVSTMNSFLKLLPSPVCMIAHCGNTFDFPLLRAEIRRKTSKSLLKDVFCADSIQVFREKRPDLDSYKLKDVFSSLCGTYANPERRHCAAGKCVITVECAQKIELFAQWVDQRKRLFSSIEPAF